MSKVNEQIQAEFHNKAAGVFFSIYHTFETAVSGISRRKEEYRFQQLKRQYALAMEQELEMAARDILLKYKNEKQVNEVDLMLSQFIKDYVHRFIQKINDL